MLVSEKLLDTILNKIEEHGFEAYIVGGYVRDRIMGAESEDIDITTSARPEDIKNIFSEYRVVETGINHGTITVFFDDVSIEITTFRTESSYKDNRHPDKVIYCSNLNDDLKRRDFTINALCMDKNGQITDLLGGRNDLESKVIRAIGKPEERFNEDALRILRALRFSSVLGFSIEEDTASAIHKCKNLVLNVSKERIAAELRKLICGKNIKNILIEYSDVFCVFLPELNECIGFKQHNFHHKYDVYSHIAVVVENSPPVDYLRLAALFHDIAKPLCFSLDENGVGHFYSHASISSGIAVAALRRLRFDNSTISLVETLVKQHDAYIDEDVKTIKRKLNRFGENMLYDLIYLQRADTLGLADEFHNRIGHFECLENIVKTIVRDNNCFSIKNLKVNGNDLIEYGLKGKDIGSALTMLVDAVIEEKTVNDKEALIDYLKENY